MTLTKKWNEATDQFEYTSDKPILLTAPHHQGDVTLPCGTTYDVTPHAVECETQLHTLQLAAVLEGKDPAHIDDAFVDAVNDPDVVTPLIADLPDAESA